MKTLDNLKAFSLKKKQMKQVKEVVVIVPT